MERVGSCRHHGPDMSHPLLSSSDSGYLFSGSRPPSQVSRSGEVPVSGKENGVAAFAGDSVGPSFPSMQWEGRGQQLD